MGQVGKKHVHSFGIPDDAVVTGKALDIAKTHLRGSGGEQDDKALTATHGVVIVACGVTQEVSGIAGEVELSKICSHVLDILIVHVLRIYIRSHLHGMQEA